MQPQNYVPWAHNHAGHYRPENWDYVPPFNLSLEGRVVNVDDLTGQTTDLPWGWSVGDLNGGDIASGYAKTLEAAKRATEEAAFGLYNPAEHLYTIN